MRINDNNFFDNWKEFSIGKPDEIILNHFDIIKNHTDLNGDIKHKNTKELIKTFSLIITHNYGTSVYELCNFLKFLNNLKISVYNVMVMNSKQIIKKIKTKEIKIKSKISNKFLLEIENYSFEMTYARIATYTVILDFIEEFLGLNEILSIEEKIDKTSSHNDLKLISNDLSKKMYDYLKDLLPSSYLQSFSAAIGNQIIDQKKDENHIIISDDISDNFILNFWINSMSLERKLRIKTYSLAADLCLSYKKSLELDAKFSLQNLDEINNHEPWNYLSSDKVELFVDQLYEDYENIISNSIKYVNDLYLQKINVLKKNEINEIKIFSKYQQISLKLPLTIFRICIFGDVQNKIIEAQRRKKLCSNKNIFFELNELNYNLKKNSYKNLIKNIEIIKNIVFYKLWNFEQRDIFSLIRNYLDQHELNYYNKFIEDQKQKLNIETSQTELDIKINPSVEINLQQNLDELFLHFKEFIKQENEGKNFKNFLNYLILFKKQEKLFRRSGFDFKTYNKENLKILLKIYHTLNEIRKFLSKFLKEFDTTVKSVDDQFRDDKQIFLEHFNYLYSAGEL